MSRIFGANLRPTEVFPMDISAICKHLWEQWPQAEIIQSGCGFGHCKGGEQVESVICRLNRFREVVSFAIITRSGQVRIQITRPTRLYCTLNKCIYFLRDRKLGLLGMQIVYTPFTCVVANENAPHFVHKPYASPWTRASMEHTYAAQRRGDGATVKRRWERQERSQYRWLGRRQWSGESTKLVHRIQELDNGPTRISGFICELGIQYYLACRRCHCGLCGREFRSFCLVCLVIYVSYITPTSDQRGHWH